MFVIDKTIDLRQLASDIDVDIEYLGPLFEALRRECDHLFPRLEDALANENFSDAHEYSHALKGLVGNMRFDDLHALAIEIDNATINCDTAYPYIEKITLIKRELSKILAS